MKINYDYINKIINLEYKNNHDNTIKLKVDDYIFSIKKDMFEDEYIINVFKEKNGRYYFENYESENFKFFCLEIKLNSKIEVLYKEKDTIVNNIFIFKEFNNINLKIETFFKPKNIYNLSINNNYAFKICERLKYKDMGNESNKRRYDGKNNLMFEYWLDKNGDRLKTIRYYKNSKKIKSIVYYKNNKIHRDNGPAIIEYDFDGNIEEKRFYKNDIIICDNSIPSCIEYINNKISNIYFLNRNGECSRKNLPASYNFQYENGKLSSILLEWYDNGKRHNNKGPATIKFDKKNSDVSELYHLNGSLITDELIKSVIYSSIDNKIGKIIDSCKKMLNIETY